MSYLDSDRPDNSYFVKKSQNNDPALLANSKEINVPQQPPKRFVQSKFFIISNSN